MKRVGLLGIICMIAAFTFSSCLFSDYIGGRATKPITTNVNIIAHQDTEIFSGDEIDDAFRTVIDNFGFNGCELVDIWYDEGFSNKEKEPQKVEENKNCIILLSNFYVNPKGAHQSFNEDSMYKNWMWILVREDENSPWVIKDYGY